MYGAGAGGAAMSSTSSGARPVVFVVLDGVGWTEPSPGNAVALAATPNLDALMTRNKAMAVTLTAHGRAVGLPSDKDCGNSEVGHNVIGCGRVVDQGSKLVADGLDSRAVFRTAAWRELVGAARAGGALHLLGLLSDGGVHSHISHLMSLIAAARRADVRRLRCHVLTDGRDVANGTAEVFVSTLEEALLPGRGEKGKFDYRIASGGGRMSTTMDRYESDWDVVRRGWEAHVLGTARPFRSTTAALAAFRAEGHTSDQFLPAWTVVDAAGDPVGRVRDGDGVVCFNFRGDRATQISQAFVQGADFSGFDRGPRVPDVVYAGMVVYDGDLNVPPRRLVEAPPIDGTLSALLAAAGCRMWACAETHKIGHITTFFNGNRSGYTAGTNRNTELFVEVPSRRDAPGETPAMRTVEVTDALLGALEERRWDFLRVNLAAPDMVGHTGDLRATVQAVALVDAQLGRIRASVRAAGGVLLVTADHGNADRMLLEGASGADADADGTSRSPCTSHSLAPVPFAAEGLPPGLSLRRHVPSRSLANVAATVAELLGVTPRREWQWEPSLLLATDGSGGGRGGDDEAASAGKESSSSSSSAPPAAAAVASSATRAGQARL